MLEIKWVVRQDSGSAIRAGITTPASFVECSLSSHSTASCAQENSSIDAPFRILGELGCDAWTLARIAGHSSISIFIFPSEDVVLHAMARLSGHDSGHNGESKEILND